MALQLWSSSSAMAAALRRLSPGIVVVALVLQFLSALCFNEAMRAPLVAAVRDLGFWEFYMVGTGGSFVGGLVPVAGNAAVRLAYLRRRGIRYIDFMWGTGLSHVLALVAAAVVAAGATVLLWMRQGMPSRLVVLLASGTLAGSLVVWSVFERLPRLAAHGRLARWPWMAGAAALAVSRATRSSVFVNSLLRHALNFVTFGLIYRALAPSGDLLAGGLTYALTSPIRMINLTPGNVGVNEWAAAAVATSLGFDLSTGLVVALIFRALLILAQAGGLAVGAIRMRHGGG